jgi:hypothetical protein
VAEAADEFDEHVGGHRHQNVRIASDRIGSLRIAPKRLREQAAATAHELARRGPASVDRHRMYA